MSRNPEISGMALPGIMEDSNENNGPRPVTVPMQQVSEVKGNGTSKPKGSKDPNNRVLEPKYYNMNGIWALKPYYLGPWTLRDRFWVVRNLLQSSRRTRP